MISAANLAFIYGGSTGRYERWIPFLAKVFTVYEINTPQRVACFLAQVGHESGRFRFLRELWGPTAQQKRYELGTTLARRLGNTHEGDGKRYAGRGLIQVTGRANYRDMTARLRRRLGMKVPDFVTAPLLLEDPTWAVLSAGEFWASRNLNTYADTYDFIGMTKRINGGTTGLFDRQYLYARAISVLI